MAIISGLSHPRKPSRMNGILSRPSQLPCHPGVLDQDAILASLKPISLKDESPLRLLS